MLGETLTNTAVLSFHRFLNEELLHLLTGCIWPFCVLHTHLDPVILSENAPEYASTCYTERNGRIPLLAVAVSGRHCHAARNTVIAPARRRHAVPIQSTRTPDDSTGYDTTKVVAKPYQALATSSLTAAIATP